MPDHKDLTTLVPKGVLRRLQAHFAEKILEAVDRYPLNAADEDSLTGALGHALSIPNPMVVTAFKGTTFSIQIESYKISGKGPGAPESRIGADGIIQITVRIDGNAVFAKGLPFQAKKAERCRFNDFAEQAETMFQTSGTGIIIRYGPEAYDALDVREFLKPQESAISQSAPGFSDLGSMLGGAFLDCHIGAVGLSFSREKADPNSPGQKGFWVIDTSIIGISTPGDVG